MKDKEIQACNIMNGWMDHCFNTYPQTVVINKSILVHTGFFSDVPQGSVFISVFPSFFMYYLCEWTENVCKMWIK